MAIPRFLSLLVIPVRGLLCGPWTTVPRLVGALELAGAFAGMLVEAAARGPDGPAAKGDGAWRV